jgi:hypothetical protein
MFRLQEITAMKLNQVKLLQEEIEKAIKMKWPYHEAECRKELVKTKYEAMHPQEVLASLAVS